MVEDDDGDVEELDVVELGAVVELDDVEELEATEELFPPLDMKPK